MNFLLRTTHPVAPELPDVPVSHKDMQSNPVTTLEGIISEDPFAKSSSSEDGERDNDDGGTPSKSNGVPNVKSHVSVGRYYDVAEEEGWITIPFKELPENWSSVSDMESFHSLDRSFLFPGEQLHILACLASSKQDTEVITPFKVAAAMSKNGILVQNSKQQMESSATGSDLTSMETDINSEHQNMAIGTIKENGGTENTNTEVDISATASLIRMENHRQQTEIMLERLKNSHFFVRIAEFDEPLWSKSSAEEHDDGSKKTSNRADLLSAVIDRGDFDGNASGGVARNTARCCSLFNGDIVVLLEVNVGIESMKNPVIEVLQFEKYPSGSLSSVNHRAVITEEDPCGELLRWLLPLDHALPLPTRPLSPPLGSSSGIGSASQRTMSPGSQLFSFGHFRSYSMPSLPQTSIPSPSPVPPSNTIPSFDFEDFDHFSDNSIKSQDLGNEGLLSFRGAPLEPERYFVQCGLGGIYLPGKRWRRKIEIIQPIEIQSFAADCNTEDLLCVQIKNICPDHIPDVIIYLDAISIVFEEAPRHGPPLFLPLSCIEAGSSHSLPNLALRRGEEHSFILKPAPLAAAAFKSCGDRSSPSSQLQLGTSGANKPMISKIGDGTNAVKTNKYAVLVSCRCNYTESKLFFNKPTSWSPRILRDLMISVASKISEQSFGPGGGISQVPVQVLTLQASNLTNEDLNLTVLAPASITAPLSVVSLNSVPTTPGSPFVGFPEFMGRVNEDKTGTSMQRLSSMPIPESQKENSNGGVRSKSLSERATPVSNVVSSSDLWCTHLWLQSTVPLGCIPPQSSATVKLELLPLTDGIITLDTLQIAIKEKGLTYIPEHSLKIHATSSITTGIL